MSLEKLRSLEEIYATFEGIADGGAPTFLSLQTEIMFNMALDLEFIANPLEVPTILEGSNGDFYPVAGGDGLSDSGVGATREGESVDCPFCGYAECWVLDDAVDEVNDTKLASGGPQHISCKCSPG